MRDSRLREEHRIKEGRLQEPPDVARAEMIRDICELAQSMQFFRPDLRVMENTGPTVEMLPIPIKYPVSHVLKELCSRIRRRDGELNCKGIELLRIADGFEDALDCIVRQPQSVIGDDA